MTQPIGYGSRGASLAKIGGALGVAGTLIGVAIFVLGCFGFSAAFTLSIIPLALAIPGIALSIGGGFQKHPDMADTQVIAAVVVNVAVIAGALLEVAIWRHWAFFSGGNAP